MLISIPLGVTFGVGGIRNFRSDHIAGPKTVVTLRDAEGYSSNEVCHLLSISAVNQRVLLHRGRAALRASIEAHWTTEAAA